MSESEECANQRLSIEDRVGERQDVELMYRFYTNLRDEINQSIDFQNQVVIGGGVFIAAAYGLQFSGILRELTVQNPMLKLIIAALPTIALFTISLWVVEQSRMMRAGHYLHFLENKINAELDGVYLTWENWLRNGNTTIYHQTHHVGQIVGYAVFLYGLAGLGLAVYAVEILGVSISSLQAGAFEWRSLAFVYFVLNVLLLVYLAQYTYRIIVHQESDGSDFEAFKAWETAYSERNTAGYAYQREIEMRREERVSKQDGYQEQ